MNLRSLFLLGRTHVPHRKSTASGKPAAISGVSEVLLPVSQHIGAPSEVCVSVGDKVSVGTVIARAGGYVGSPVHSSVSGTVKKIEVFLTSAGRRCDAVLIESDGLMTHDAAIAPPEVNDLDGLCTAVRNSGLVGLGGAGFPTSVKLDGAKGGNIKKIIINAAECEPYITSDTITMLSDGENIKYGAELLLKYITADELIIGIENNKPECIAAMEGLFADNERVRVATLPSTYPQGGEKILIYNTTGLAVPEGGLPSDVGVLVLNVTTLAFIAKYVKTGVPLVEKCITVDGSAVKAPMNVVAPIGTRISELLQFAGVDECDAGKILLGGPMMGVPVYSAESPVMKNTNAITVMNKKDAVGAEPTPCIHCGRCVEACPMGLNPTLYARAQDLSDEAEKVKRLKDAKINLCIECGCCSYVCPAKRPLVQKNRLGKSDVSSYDKKMKELEEMRNAVKEVKE